VGECAILAPVDAIVFAFIAAQARIFERFSKADESRTHGGGTGLGLAASARHIVEGHGGEIRVPSAEGEGPALTLTVPIPATELAAAAPLRANRGDR
jgi:signal transduction histidine kinase